MDTAIFLFLVMGCVLFFTQLIIFKFCMLHMCQDKQHILQSDTWPGGVY